MFFLSSQQHFAHFSGVLMSVVGGNKPSAVAYPLIPGGEMKGQNMVCWTPGESAGWGLLGLTRARHLKLGESSFPKEGKVLGD